MCLLCPFLSTDTVPSTFFCFSAVMLAHFALPVARTVRIDLIAHREVRILKLFENIVAKIKEVTTLEKNA